MCPPLFPGIIVAHPESQATVRCAGMAGAVLCAGELRMNPKDKNIKSGDDGISPLFPIVLLATLIAGAVLAIFKMIGIF